MHGTLWTRIELYCLWVLDRTVKYAWKETKRKDQITLCAHISALMDFFWAFPRFSVAVKSGRKNKLGISFLSWRLLAAQSFVMLIGSLRGNEKNKTYSDKVEKNAFKLGKKCIKINLDSKIQNGQSFAVDIQTRILCRIVGKVRYG